MVALFRSILALVILANVSHVFAATNALAPTSVPITFEENRGQASPQYAYVLHHGLEALFFQQGTDFVLSAHGAQERLRLEFLSTNSHAKPVAEQLLPAQSNYLLGSNTAAFIRHVPNYGDLRYQDIYSGVNLDFYGTGNTLEHDFTIAPHTDPSVIAFQLQGAKSVALIPNGDLLVQMSEGTLTLKKPVAYQMYGERRHSVAAEFLEKDNGSIGFRVGAYDIRRPLVIDPVFTFSTYLDGTLTDQVGAVTTDSAGNIYLTGTTASTDFPTHNPEQSQLACASGPFSCQNAFITKLDPSGKTLLYSTYLGGIGEDFGGAIAVDGNGNAIVGGVTSSLNFPQAGSIQPYACPGNNECYFLASLKADGSGLNYSGPIGGAQGSFTNGNDGRLALDASGNAYLAGVTNSLDFQLTPGTLSTSLSGYPYTTLFVLKVDPTGKLLYATVVPGNAPQNPADVLNNWFLPTAIAVDSSGQVTVAGTAGLGLPTTAGVVASAFPNNTNTTDPTAGFVLQLNTSASAINYATYVPGTDSLGGMDVDSSGNLYLAGSTGESNLPVSANAYQKALIPGPECTCGSGYILKLNPQGTSVLAATYLSGTPAQSNLGTSFEAVVLDSQSNVFLGGETGSSDFPLLDPLTSEFATLDIVLAEMSPDLSTLKFGSFLGSTDLGGGATFSGLTLDPNNNLVVAGTTFSSDFPTTAGSFQVQPPPSSNPNLGHVHSVVSKINLSTPAPSFCPVAWSVSLGQVTALSSSQQTLNIVNCGNAPLNFGSITSSIATISASQSCGAVAPGATCAVEFTFSPIDGTQSTGTVSFAGNMAVSPQIIQVSGQGVAPDLEPSANPFAFGHLLAGTQGTPQTLLLTNRGNGPLTISSVSISGAGFSIAQNDCTVKLPAGVPCTMSLAFSPASAGAFTGSLSLQSNDPVHPQLVIALTGTGDSTYGNPVITDVLEGTSVVPQQTLQINNGPVNLVVNGSNFYPASVVAWNGASQATTFVSNTAIKVMVEASSLTTLGEFPLTVVNPGGGASAPVTMTTYQLLPLSPSALVSVPATNFLYAAMPASDATNPNTLIPVNPATGATGTPIPVGKNPALLAASSDGAYLYVANATDLTVQRINLHTNAVERTFPYSPDSACSGCGVPAATDLKTIPGSPQEVVLAQGGEVSLYNDSGLVNYVPTAFVPTFAPTFNSIAFAGNPLALYAQPFTGVQNPPSFFTTVAITGSGLQYTGITGTGYGIPTGTGGQVVSDGTLLYTDSGEVWSPATQTKVGNFPASFVYQGVGDLVLDTTLGHLYVTGWKNLTGAGGESYSSLAISSFGQQSLAAEQTLAFPLVQATASIDLGRWGSNGFAFVVPGAFGSGAGIYLTRSSPLAGMPSNPVPAVTSIQPDHATVGAAVLGLTVNGTGFVSASVINWNGVALATSYVSATQLTAMVPASDLAAAGTLPISVTTPAPGGGTSLAQPFMVETPRSLSLGKYSQLRQHTRGHSQHCGNRHAYKPG